MGFLLACPSGGLLHTLKDLGVLAAIVLSLICVVRVVLSKSLCARLAHGAVAAVAFCYPVLVYPAIAGG